MRFWTTLLRGDDRLLALLEASAEEGRASMMALQALLRSPPSALSVEAILQSRERERVIDEAIEELLCDGASAPLDRDEIELLARVLDGVPKGIKKFAMRYQLCAGRMRDVSFGPQLGRLEEAVATVCQMVAGLRRPQLALTKRLHDVLQNVEGEADKLFLGLVADLQKRRHEPMTALMLRDLCEVLERTIDRCRAAGNIILRMVLKHS